MNMKTIAAAAAIAVSTPIAASAVTIDFTGNDYTYNAGVSASGTVFGETWTLTSTPAGQLTRTNYDGAAGATGGLAELYDGFGVVDDEVSEGGLEYIHLSFSRAVKMTGLYFLDLFVPEEALVWFGTSAVGDADLKIQGTESFPGTGFLNFGTDVYVQHLTFGVTPSPNNDPAGVADYAVAGIEVVPLPAAGLMLLGGLGGLVAAKRRKKA